MKKLLKIGSLLMLLISGVTFAQYSPGGCIPTPPPLDKLIPKPILTDQGFSLEKATNLSGFLKSMNEAIDSGVTSNDFKKYEPEYINNGNYIWAKNIIQNTNGSVDELVNNLNNKLAQAKSEDDKAFCVLYLYSIQMLTSKGLLNQQSSTTSRPCTPKEKLELLAAGMTIGSLIEPGGGTAVGALVGGLIGTFGGC